AKSVALVARAYYVSLVTFDPITKNIEHLAESGPGTSNGYGLDPTTLWDGLNGWVLQQLQPVSIPKQQTDPRESEAELQWRTSLNDSGSILRIPLRYQGKALGLMTLVNQSDGIDFTNAEEDLMMIVADQIAVAIENANLFKARRKSEEHFRTLIDNAPVIMFAIDRSGIFTMSEGKGLQALGHRPGEMVGQSIFEVYQNHADILDGIRHALAGEARSQSVDLKDTAFDIHYLPYRDDRGQVDGVISVALDVTERKRAQAKIEQLAKFVAENPNPVLRVAHDGTILYANDASSILLADWHCRVGEQLSNDWCQQISDVLVSGLNVEMLIECEDQFYALMIVPIVEGNYVNIYGRNITEYKQAEQFREKIEQRYRSLFEEAPMMYVLTRNQNGLPIITDCNQTFIKTLGYERNEIIGKALAEVYAPYSRDQLINGGYQLAINQEFTTEERELMTRHGEFIQTLLHATPDSDERGNVIGTRAVFFDITQRKHAERKLNRQRRLMQGVAEATQYLLLESDFDAAVHQMLTVVGEMANVDRVYIFNNRPHPTKADCFVISKKFEWTRASIPPHITAADPQNLSWYDHGLGRWYETLSTGGALVGAIRDFPAVERELLAAQQILSMLVVPIHIEDEFWGYIGLDDCHLEREWTK
ncbi:MAG: PAS domain S-box protein, partial [Anaerolineae bacterium]|nr:PAS domain S-box protein [Anaerolineae bacterium]